MPHAIFGSSDQKKTEETKIQKNWFDYIFSFKLALLYHIPLSYSSIYWIDKCSVIITYKVYTGTYWQDSNRMSTFTKKLTFTNIQKLM